MSIPGPHGLHWYQFPRLICAARGSKLLKQPCPLKTSASIGGMWLRELTDCSENHTHFTDCTDGRFAEEWYLLGIPFYHLFRKNKSVSLLLLLCVHLLLKEDNLPIDFALTLSFLETLYLCFWCVQIRLGLIKFDVDSCGHWCDECQRALNLSRCSSHDWKMHMA